MWEPQLKLAEHGWRVIAPHFRGFDEPADGHPANHPTVDDYAGHVVDLLDSLHVTEAVFCGLSMGGYVLFALLRHAARYVQGVVLADTRPQADTPEGVEARKRMLTIAAEKGAPGVADEMVPKLLGETTRREEPDVAERVRSLILSNDATAIANAVNVLMTRPDSTPLLASIHIPAMIVVGEEDTLTPPALSQDMQRAVAGADLAIIAGAGHLSNIEQPEAFNAVVARFLEQRL